MVLCLCAENYSKGTQVGITVVVCFLMNVPWCLSIAVISPAAVSGSPALPKGLSSISSLGSMDTGGAEPITGL